MFPCDKTCLEFKLFTIIRKRKFFSQISAQKFVAPPHPSPRMADLSAPPLEATTAPAETSNTSPLNINCEVAISHVAHFIQSDECPSGIELPDLSHLSNSEFLQKVSELLLLPSLTECICIAFFPVLTDLVGRWASLGDESIERVAGALGRLIHIEPKLKRYPLLLDRANLM